MCRFPTFSTISLVTFLNHMSGYIFRPLPMSGYAFTGSLNFRRELGGEKHTKKKSIKYRVLEDISEFKNRLNPDFCSTEYDNRQRLLVLKLPRYNAHPQETRGVCVAVVTLLSIVLMHPYRGPTLWARNRNRRLPQYRMLHPPLIFRFLP